MKKFKNIININNKYQQNDIRFMLFSASTDESLDTSHFYDRVNQRKSAILAGACAEYDEDERGATRACTRHERAR